MKPPPFAYVAAESVAEALEALDEHGYDARPLAGGQSLVPMLNFRLARPRVLVDLNRIEELSRLQGPWEDGMPDRLRVGAMARQAEVQRSPLAGETAPLLVDALSHVAHPAIRSRGTIGGSLAHADPAAELPAVALVLDARLRLRRSGAERVVSAADFFLAPFSTRLEPEELLVEIEVPLLPARAGWAFAEVARRSGDFALLGVAAVVELDESGRCRAARLAYVNAGPVPMVGAAAAATLVDEEPTKEVFLAAAEAAAAEDVDPPGDVHASAAYRRRLTRVLTRRVLESAFERASTRTSGADGSP